MPLNILIPILVVVVGIVMFFVAAAINYTVAEPKGDEELTGFFVRQYLRRKKVVHPLAIIATLAILGGTISFVVSGLSDLVAHH